MPWESVKCFLKLAEKYPIYYAQGPYLYENRNIVFRYAKKYNQPILMVDSDIVFKMEDVEKIKDYLQSLDIITGVYCLDNMPYPAAILKKTENSYQFVKPPEELTEIDVCGAGFLGISLKVVKEMSEESFNNVCEKEVPHGEDISFCHRAKQMGFKIWCDPKILIGQVKNKIIYFKRYIKVRIRKGYLEFIDG